MKDVLVWPIKLRFSREKYEKRKQFVVGIRGQIFESMVNLSRKKEIREPFPDFHRPERTDFFSIDECLQVQTQQ